MTTVDLGHPHGARAGLLRPPHWTTSHSPCSPSWPFTATPMNNQRKGLQ